MEGGRRAPNPTVETVLTVVPVCGFGRCLYGSCVLPRSLAAKSVANLPGICRHSSFHAFSRSGHLRRRSSTPSPPTANKASVAGWGVTGQEPMEFLLPRRSVVEYSE